MSSFLFHRLNIRLSKVAVSCFILSFGMPAAWSLAASTQEVELKLTVLPGSSQMMEGWLVSVRRTSGNQVPARVADTGRPIVFRHLEPDIYLVCAQSGVRRKCQSIDMFLPEGQKKQQFTMNLAPEETRLNAPGAHSVKVSALRVPLKAQHEMIESEKAELRGDKADMLAHLKRATDIDGGYPDALNNLGVIYSREGNRELSRQYFAKAVQLDPDSGLAWMNLAEVLICARQWEQALSASMQAIAHAPDDALANSQLALSYYFLERYSDAERFFRRVYELDPAFADMPMLFLASISLIKNDRRKAEEYIGAFLKIHPYSPDAPAWKRTLRSLASGETATQLGISAQNHQR